MDFSSTLRRISTSHTFYLSILGVFRTILYIKGWYIRKYVLNAVDSTIRPISDTNDLNVFTVISFVSVFYNIVSI